MDLIDCTHTNPTLLFKLYINIQVNYRFLYIKNQVTSQLYLFTHKNPETQKNKELGKQSPQCYLYFSFSFNR